MGKNGRKLGPLSSSSSPSPGSPQVSPAPWLVAAHPSHCIQWVYGDWIEKIPLIKLPSFSKMQISRLYLFSSLILQVVWQQEGFGCVWSHQQHYLELGASPIFPNTKTINRWKIKELIPWSKAKSISLGGKLSLRDSLQSFFISPCPTGVWVSQNSLRDKVSAEVEFSFWLK